MKRETGSSNHRSDKMNASPEECQEFQQEFTIPKAVDFADLFVPDEGPGEEEGIQTTWPQNAGAASPTLSGSFLPVDRLGGFRTVRVSALGADGDDEDIPEIEVVVPEEERPLTPGLNASRSGRIGDMMKERSFRRSRSPNARSRGGKSKTRPHAWEDGFSEREERSPQARQRKGLREEDDDEGEHPGSLAPLIPNSLDADYGYSKSSNELRSVKSMPVLPREYSMLERPSTSQMQRRPASRKPAPRLHSPTELDADTDTGFPLCPPSNLSSGRKHHGGSPLSAAGMAASPGGGGSTPSPGKNRSLLGPDSLDQIAPPDPILPRDFRSPGRVSVDPYPAKPLLIRQLESAVKEGPQTLPSRLRCQSPQSQCQSPNKKIQPKIFPGSSSARGLMSRTLPSREERQLRQLEKNFAKLWEDRLLRLSEHFTRKVDLLSALAQACRGVRSLKGVPCSMVKPPQALCALAKVPDHDPDRACALLVDPDFLSEVELVMEVVDVQSYMNLSHQQQKRSPGGVQQPSGADPWGMDTSNYSAQSYYSPYSPSWSSEAGETNHTLTGRRPQTAIGEMPGGASSRDSSRAATGRRPRTAAGEVSRDGRPSSVRGGARLPTNPRRPRTAATGEVAGGFSKQCLVDSARFSGTKDSLNQRTQFMDTLASKRTVNSQVSERLEKMKSTQKLPVSSMIDSVMNAMNVSSQTVHVIDDLSSLKGIPFSKQFST